MEVGASPIRLDESSCVESGSIAPWTSDHVGLELMHFLSSDEIQFYIVTLLAGLALFLLFRRKKSDSSSGCNDCSS